MDAIEALKTRRSVRAYDSREVTREILTDLVDCGRLAPSGMNVQPWDFVVITAADTRQRLGDLCEYGGFIAEAPACIAVVGREERFTVQDTACAATCIMVAARAHGLCSCWVHVQGKPIEREVNRLLGVPADRHVICLLAVGYGETPPPPAKRPLADVLHWERLAD